MSIMGGRILVEDGSNDPEPNPTREIPEGVSAMKMRALSVKADLHVKAIVRPEIIGLGAVVRGKYVDELLVIEGFPSTLDRNVIDTLDEGMGWNDILRKLRITCPVHSIVSIRLVRYLRRTHRRTRWTFAILPVSDPMSVVKRMGIPPTR